jgi:hypothetical protein
MTLKATVVNEPPKANATVEQPFSVINGLTGVELERALNSFATMPGVTHEVIAEPTGSEERLSFTLIIRQQV